MATTMTATLDRNEYARRHRAIDKAATVLGRAKQHLMNRAIQAGTDTVEGIRFDYSVTDAFDVIDPIINAFWCEDAANRKAAGIGIYSPYGCRSRR